MGVLSKRRLGNGWGLTGNTRHSENDHERRPRQHHTRMSAPQGLRRASLFTWGSSSNEPHVNREAPLDLLWVDTPKVKQDNHEEMDFRWVIFFFTLAEWTKFFFLFIRVRTAVGDAPVNTQKAFVGAVDTGKIEKEKKKAFEHRGKLSA